MNKDCKLKESLLALEKAAAEMDATREASNRAQDAWAAAKEEAARVIRSLGLKSTPIVHGDLIYQLNPAADGKDYLDIERWTGKVL